MNPSALRIVVAGAVATASRQAGSASAVLQYLHGFRGMGHDVWFIDQLDSSPAKPPGGDIEFCAQVMQDAGFGDRFSILERHREASYGLDRARVGRLLSSTDVLINLSGNVSDPALYERASIRVFVDLDPAFTQYWARTETGFNLADHTHFATVGWEIGRPGCQVPTLGRSWIKLRPPVSLKHWPRQSSRPTFGFTTVANWRSYGPVSAENAVLGLKVHSFRALSQLPHLTSVPIGAALHIAPGDAADRIALEDGGWVISDAASLGSVADYQQFINSSTGEIGVAKHGYVVTRCGWFSERSAAYLASGRPVVAQSTGFEDCLPVGSGLLVFEDSATAAAAIDVVMTDYKRHSDHARQLAEEYFAADRALAALIDAVHATSASSEHDN